MTKNAVVIVGSGPTGLMLAGELALAGVDVAIVERRASQYLPGSRAGGLHARTIEVLDQRGIADRFLAEGQVAQVAGFARNTFDISDFPTRHPYGLGLWQNHIERILACWGDELAVTIYREREVTGFAQDDTGVDVQLDVGEARGRMLLTGRDEPLRDATLIEHLDGARVETTGARSVELLSDAPFDDDDVDVRQRQLARQHQPRRASSRDHHRMFSHRCPR